MLELGETAQKSGGFDLSVLLPLVLMAAVFYLLVLRPRQKKVRQQAEMQSAMAPGDEVVTIGGLYGTVTQVDDDIVTLEVAPGVQTRYARGAISRVISPVSADEETEADTTSDQSDKIVDSD